MKKTKIGIKTRVFLSFGLLVIVVINIFIFALYNLIGISQVKNVEKDMQHYTQLLIEEMDHIEEKTKQNSYIFNINPQLSKDIEQAGLFFSIFLNSKKIEQNYQIGTYMYDNKIISRYDYKNYKIIIGRDITEFNNFKKTIIDQIIFINAFLVILVFAMSYFIADRVLNPLLKLAKQLSNYDIQKDTKLIENKYGDSEIGVITDAVNKFIGNSKQVLQDQKQFIQDSSHELKTPLMQIQSNLELLEAKITDEKIHNKLEHIRSSTENINTIVSNLSFIMRGEEKITKKEKINIEQYLQNLVTDFYALANEKNITIDVVTKENFVLENSPYYLDRLFGNILQNAIFYNNGNGIILIKIDKNTVVISDEGIGIAQKELEKIFSRFYRHTGSSDYNKDGSGLGLPIVQKICKDFGWKLSVQSTKGEGSRFEIQF